MDRRTFVGSMAARAANSLLSRIAFAQTAPKAKNGRATNRLRSYATKHQGGYPSINVAQRQPASIGHNKGETPLFAVSIE
jgi:hypothetical protein